MKSPLGGVESPQLKRAPSASPSPAPPAKAARTQTPDLVPRNANVIGIAKSDASAVLTPQSPRHSNSTPAVSSAESSSPSRVSRPSASHPVDPGHRAPSAAPPPSLFVSTSQPSLLPPQILTGGGLDGLRHLLQPAGTPFQNPLFSMNAGQSLPPFTAILLQQQQQAAAAAAAAQQGAQASAPAPPQAPVQLPSQTLPSQPPPVPPSSVAAAQMFPMAALASQLAGAAVLGKVPFVANAPAAKKPGKWCSMHVKIAYDISTYKKAHAATGAATTSDQRAPPLPPAPEPPRETAHAAPFVTAQQQTPQLRVQPPHCVPSTSSATAQQSSSLLPPLLPGLTAGGPLGASFGSSLGGPLGGALGAANPALAAVNLALLQSNPSLQLTANPMLAALQEQLKQQHLQQQQQLAQAAQAHAQARQSAMTPKAAAPLPPQQRPPSVVASARGLGGPVGGPLGVQLQSGLPLGPPLAGSGSLTNGTSDAAAQSAMLQALAAQQHTLTVPHSQASLLQSLHMSGVSELLRLQEQQQLERFQQQQQQQQQQVPPQSDRDLLLRQLYASQLQSSSGLGAPLAQLTQQLTPSLAPQLAALPPRPPTAQSSQPAMDAALLDLQRQHQLLNAQFRGGFSGGVALQQLAASMPGAGALPQSSSSAAGGLFSVLQTPPSALYNNKLPFSQSLEQLARQKRDGSDLLSNGR